MGHVTTTTTLLAVLLVAGCTSTTGSGGSEPTVQTSQEWSIDRPTDDWFSTLCGVIPALDPSFDGTTDQVVSELTDTGDTLILTSSQLGAKPVPTFDGGSAFAADAVSDLAELGRAFHVAAEQWDAGRPDSAREALQQSVSDRSPDLSSLDPKVSVQLRNLPACQSVRPTF